MYIHSSSTILVYRSRVRNDICGTYDTVAHAFDWCLVCSPQGPLPRGRCRRGPLAAGAACRGLSGAVVEAAAAAAATKDSGGGGSNTSFSVKNFSCCVQHGSLREAQFTTILSH